MSNQKEIPKADRGFLGEVFESNNCGEFRILRRSGKLPTGDALYTIEFVATGYQREVTKGRAKGGSIRDPYYPAICGVACTGDTLTTTDEGTAKRSYNQWYNMIRRCYDESKSNFSHFGALGIRVCERWKCFEHYEEDIKKLPGRDNPDNVAVSRINLDGNYSPENCQWSPAEGLGRGPDFQQKFLAISPDYEIFIGRNQRQFAREHSLTHQSISQCLKGEQSTHKGWLFCHLDYFREVWPTDLIAKLKGADQ